MQRADRGVGRVDREAQRRIGAGAADELVDGGQLAHRRLQALAVELAELAGVALGERLRSLEGIGQPPLDAGGALALHQRLEIPRGRLELGVAGLGRSAA